MLPLCKGKTHQIFIYKVALALSKPVLRYATNPAIIKIWEME